MNKHMESQPARAVWIEMIPVAGIGPTQYRHSLRGLCGLKCFLVYVSFVDYSHSLRGLCGLKCNGIDAPCPILRHSLRGLCGLKYDYTTGTYKRYYVTACEGCVD